MSPRVRAPKRLLIEFTEPPASAPVDFVPAPQGPQVYPAWWTWPNHALDPEKEFRAGKAPDVYVQIVREDRDLFICVFRRMSANITVPVTALDWQKGDYDVPRDRFRRMRQTFGHPLHLHILGAQAREIVDIRIFGTDGAYGVEAVCKQPWSNNP